MNDTDLPSFKTTVSDSRLLTGIQKQELLDRPELLPEAYRQKVAAVLLRYEAQADARYAAVSGKLDETTKKLGKELASSDLSDAEKQDVRNRVQQATIDVLPDMPAA